jgi:DNA-binding NarL/FixJ family response regulator
LASTHARSLRLAMADDHPVVSHAIQEYLDRDPDIAVVAIANGYEALDAVVREHRPDLVLLDISMEPGWSPTATIHHLRQIHPSLKVMIYSAHDEAYWVLRMMEARVDGYVHKTEPLPVLLEAIRRAAAGEVWFSHHLLNTLAAQYDQQYVLEEQERVLLQAIADGENLNALSVSLHISKRTAERHLSRALEKLGADSRVEAVATALRLGMIE